MKDLTILGYDFSDWSEEKFNAFMMLDWFFLDDEGEENFYSGQSPDDFAQWLTVNEYALFGCPYGLTFEDTIADFEYWYD